MLVQGQDNRLLDSQACRTVTGARPDPAVEADLVFAMKVVKHVRSYAIVLVKNLQTVGIGPGQPNRITSLMIALDHAGNKASGSIMGSDAFIPFSDCIDAAAKGGIAAIIQPGGSIRDQAVIDACNQNGIAMLFTGMRHFRH